MEKKITQEKVFELSPEMLEAIKEGEEDIKAGRVHSHEDVMKEIDDWLKE